MSRDQIGLQIKTEKIMRSALYTLQKNEIDANGVGKSACLIKKANYTEITV